MKAFAVAIWVLSGSVSLAQQHYSEELLEQQQSTNESAFGDFQGYADRLELLQRKPVALNRANSEELSALMFLDQSKIAALLNYRMEFGHILDWEELYRIAGFDEKLIEFLKNHATLKLPAAATGKELGSGHFTQVLRMSSSLKKAAGYQAKGPNQFPAYEGQRLHLYSRSRYVVPGKLSAGFITEKDPGEKTFNHLHPVHPDFTSAHLWFNLNRGFLKTVVMGDYRFVSGLGLVFGNGFGVFKSARSMQVYQPFGGLQAYTSAHESNFLRGMGITLGHKKWQTTLISSNKWIDGSYGKDRSQIGSLSNTGLHRTQTELNRRKVVNETVFGFSEKLNTGRLCVSLSVLAWQYELARVPRIREKLVGVFSTYQLNGGIAFGEIAWNDPENRALVMGFVSSLSKKINLSAVYRHYDEKFGNPFGNGFSHSGRNHNEKGFYLGVEYLIDHRFNLSAYVDQYAYPRPSFYTRFPASQKDLLGQLTYQPKRKLSGYVRVRYQQIQKDEAVSDFQKKSFFGEKINLRLNVEIKFPASLSLKFRMEQCGKNAFGGRGGWLIFQDFGVRDLWKTFDFACRIARFNALNYEDRIYAFENDVPYSFSIPAYSGNGYRIYLLFSANISRRLKCWIRYGNWIYKNVSSVGSGYESVSGNSQPQLSILISAKID